MTFDKHRQIKRPHIPLADDLPSFPPEVLMKPADSDELLSRTFVLMDKPLLIVRRGKISVKLLHLIALFRYRLEDLACAKSGWKMLLFPASIAGSFQKMESIIFTIFEVQMEHL